LCQTDIKRWMTGFNRAALLALSTVVKQHAKNPTLYTRVVCLPD